MGPHLIRTQKEVRGKVGALIPVWVLSPHALYPARELCSGGQACSSPDPSFAPFLGYSLAL